MERRGSLRVLTSSPVTAWSDGDSSTPGAQASAEPVPLRPSLLCDLHDVSLTGLGLYYPEELKPESRIFVDLELMDGVDCTVWGTVARLKPGPFGHLTGVKFEDSAATQWAQLSQLLKSLVAAGEPDRDPSPENYTVLVVDASRTQAALTVAALRAYGFQVAIASSVDTALSVVFQQQPDLVLTDLSLPGCDGMELCRQLQMDLPQLPVVVQTEFSARGMPERIRRSGATSVLLKDHCEAPLVAAINDALHLTAAAT